MTIDDSNNGKPPATWRVGEEQAQALLDAQPLLEKRLRLSMSRTQVIDYVIARGLEALELGEPTGTDDPAAGTLIWPWR